MATRSYPPVLSEIRRIGFELYGRYGWRDDRVYEIIEGVREKALQASLHRGEK